MIVDTMKVGLVGELVNRIIRHFICLLQFNKLSDSESHAIILTPVAYTSVL